MYKNIRNVFFDLDDTLFPTAQFTELARKNAIRSMIQHGLKTDFDSGYNNLIEIIKKKGSNYGHHFNLLCKKFNHDMLPKIIASGMISYHNSKNTILPFVNTYSTLLKLKEEGFRMFIATNGNPIKQWEKILRLNIDIYFDYVFISEQVGMKKSTMFFKKILKKLDLKPECCAMIGNSLDIDVYPALGAGMRAILVDHYKRFDSLKPMCKVENRVYYCSTERTKLEEMGLCKKQKHANCTDKQFAIINDLEQILGILENGR